MKRASSPLESVAANAAFLVHEDGATTEAAADYIQRWRLWSRARAEHGVSFLADPLWRSYVTTYTDGERGARLGRRRSAAVQAAAHRAADAADLLEETGGGCNHALVLQRHEGRPDAHDHVLGLREHLVGDVVCGVSGGHLDPDLALGRASSPTCRSSSRSRSRSGIGAAST